MNITEDYCSYEVAKLLKEKGFHEPCIATYNSTTKNFQVEEIYEDWTVHWKDYISAPTHQMALKWLREVYGLHIWVDYSRLDCNEKQPYLWNIVETKIDGDYWEGTYNKSPKNAVESALNYTLKNLI